tara:strand:- start:2728 stop:3081 length:354 start_codon:yes stop_codon:yes gene_type:complete
MKKFPTEAEFQFQIIPRTYITAGEVILRDRLKNTTQTYSASFTRSANYLNITLDINPALVESRQYDLWVVDFDDNIVYRDTAFATDQVLNQNANQVYDINQSQYNQHSTGNNDFVII